ncbi:MAG TPA: autotransporter-associated beta strand repeat-containing protein [Chthoniobacterales bacterium]|jgi:autotransporter-associated beta strand protein
MKSLTLKSLAAISALFLAVVVSASAQTSGTLATQSNQSWSTAPWFITSGFGTYPDGGGTAEFDTFVNNIIGTLPGLTIITMDVTPTLSSITFNSPFSYELAAGAGGINMDAGGCTFNMALTSMSTPTLTQLADPILATISGGGTNGLTVTGQGTLTLQGTNTYTGGTHVNGGTLALASTAAVGDAVLGATGAGNGISMNGGTIANDVTGGWTTGRDVSLGANGGTFLLFTAATINGVVSGAGSLTINNSTLTLTNTNTYQGATILNSSFSGLTLSGNGSINQSSGIDLAGTLTLTNSVTNNADRLNDTGTITDRGATIAMTGNASAATNEVAGSLILANGVSTITVTPNAAQQASLGFSSITRQNDSTLFVRGTNLGATAGNGVAEITSTAAPGTLVGGGGAATSQNISILPWAVGNTSATATANSSFVTYDPATGQFRPLATSEYSTLASGEADTNNTVVSGTTTISAATTVNSVLVTGTGTKLSGTGGLNITSGALMYSPTSGTTAGTISANINFGSAEGVISSTGGTANSLTAGLTMSGVISGTGGLTLNPITGSDIALTNANSSYTGTTTLLGGLTIVSGTIASGSNSVFGADTSALNLNFSNNSNLNGIYASAATTLNRGLNVIGSSNSSAFLVTSAAYAFTVNGNISLANNTRLDLYNTGSGTATNAFILNGVISGAGGLSDNATTTTFTQLNGANTFTGGTNIQTGTYEVGVDSTGTSGAFGTGTIYFSGAGGAIQSVNGTAHTISNDIFIGSALSATASSNPTFKGTGALNFTGNVNLNGSRGLNVTNTAPTTFSGVVSNGAVTKFGTGTMALTHSSGNTYTGGTVLGTTAGILNVNNSSGSGTGSGTVSIGGSTSSNRSTLSGNFTISGATQVSGVLSPGNGATLNGVGDTGTANFSSSLSLTSNTVVTLELASTVNFDKINVGSLLTLGGTINVTGIGGYVAQLGDSFTLLTWGSLNSTNFTIANLNTSGAATAAGTTWDTSTFLTDGTIRVVPEPATVALFIAGGLSLFVAARRRRA